MTIPKQSDVEIPLLRALAQLGGQGTADAVYRLVTESFPDLTDADVNERLPSGQPRWRNRVHWVRQRLIQRGDITSPSRGIWALTDQGRRRLEALGSEPMEAAPDDRTLGADLVELYDEYLDTFRQQLVQRLLDLSPQQFERFAVWLLEAYGFHDVQVTQVSRDGGIDGHGRLRVGLAILNAAFQCKRWTQRVSRVEVDSFRGAIQGRFEQGLFFTTSDFTAEAQQASIRPGAVPVFLFDGMTIAQIMIDKGIGVSRQPLVLYEVDAESLLEEDVAEPGF